MPVFIKVNANLKQKIYDIESKIYEYYQCLTKPAFESTVAFSIVLVGILGTIMAIHGFKAEIAASNVKLAEIQRLSETSALLNAMRIEKMRLAAGYDSFKRQERLDEIRAAINPYVVEAVHSSTPVKVFIGAEKSSYVIETSDGATEIAISMVTVNNIKYTPEQRKLLTMAYHIGLDVGFPETIQALLLQETRAGAFGDRIGDTNLQMGKRSYGVMQMKVATARKVLKKHKEIIPKYFPRRKEYKRLRDEEIIIKLIQDDEFNIRLAALNFEMHRRKSKNWAQAVVAYNTGQSAANKLKNPKVHGYYNHILKRMISEVRPFNTETKLTL